MTTYQSMMLSVCFCVLVLTWIAVAVETIFNERKEEKRRMEHEQREKDQAARDLEYHEKRMKSLDK